MILRALYDYYQSRRDSLPSQGTELKEIGFILVLNRNGEFLRFEDRRTSDRKNADLFLVRKSVGRTAAPLANFLYDNSAYVLGYSDKDNIDSLKYYSTFKDKILSVYEKYPDNSDLKSLVKFYEIDPAARLELLKQDPLWEEIIKNLNKKFSFFSFRIDGDDKILAERNELISMDFSMSEQECADDASTFVCLVSGERGRAVNTTTATMIPGSQATAKLVAFQVKSGYDSYGKTKGENAPICSTSEFAYTTALNTLLGKKSRNKFMVGNRTFLFWGSEVDSASREIENGLCDLFQIDSGLSEEGPDIESVRRIFQSVYSGIVPSGSSDRFYILGLSPNSARIAVCYWADIPLKEFARNILAHFEDFSIVDTRKEKKPYSGLKSILSAVTLGGKSSEVMPNLPEALSKSIFQRLPYPALLYEACIRRIRAEQRVGITRAAILKAYLNRLINNNSIKINEMLDTTNNNPAYLCGRLFAVIEKIQYDANKISTTRERYLNSASSNPVAVFPTLLNLSTHHSEKLSAGSSIFYENIKREIMSKMSPDGFPVQLSLADQGRFFIGYYHQMQSFFTPKEEK
ncbi:MAG: type I-C CRISPR-associated protein Cas8c/Csd1 [Muribaculaceae bacterium]|nr:type I-C CRISPR-associated protein Cas8c/Csd1 [Muribaculaceae bacterium]